MSHSLPFHPKDYLGLAFVRDTKGNILTKNDLRSDEYRDVDSMDLKQFRALVFETFGIQF